MGSDQLVTGQSAPGVTIVDVAACAVDVIKTLYQKGGRNFLFQNVRAIFLLVGGLPNNCLLTDNPAGPNSNVCCRLISGTSLGFGVEVLNSSSLAGSLLDCGPQHYSVEHRPFHFLVTIVHTTHSRSSQMMKELVASGNSISRLLLNALAPTLPGAVIGTSFILLPCHFPTLRYVQATSTRMRSSPTSTPTPART